MESISLEQCDAELTSANDIPKDSTQASNIDLSSNHTSGLIAAQVDLQVTSPLDDTFTLSEPEPRVGWKTFDETTISYDFDFPLVPSPPQTPPGSPKRDNITPTRTPRKKDALRRETLLFSHEEGGLAQGVEEAGGALLTVLRGMLTIGLDGGALIASSIFFILPSKLREKVDSLDPIVQEFRLWFEVLVALALLVLEVLAEVLIFLWRRARPYKPGLLVFSFGGLVVALFGGYFSLTIAAAEAFKLCGYSSTLTSFQVVCADVQRYLAAQREAKRLEEEAREKRRSARRSARLALRMDSQDGKEQFQEVVSAPIDNNEAYDDIEDDEEDLPWLEDEPTQSLGHAHVLQQLYSLLSHVDPQHMSEVVMGVNKGLLSVVTTLKVQFAKTMTLGNALASSIDPPLRAVLLPRLHSTLPEGLRRWAPYIFRYSLKCATIYAAYRLSRFVASYHSALRGGQMCALYLGKYLVAIKRIHRHTLDSNMHLVTAFGYLISLVGLGFQLYHVYIPFPLNVILFPVGLVETALLWLVNQSFYFFPSPLAVVA